MRANDRTNNVRLLDGVGIRRLRNQEKERVAVSAGRGRLVGVGDRRWPEGPQGEGQRATAESRHRVQRLPCAWLPVEQDGSRAARANRQALAANTGRGCRSACWSCGGGGA